MGKISEKYNEIKELLNECELDHIELSDPTYNGIDVNAYAYWLCFTDVNGTLNDLLENIQLYGGIK